MLVLTETEILNFETTMRTDPTLCVAKVKVRRSRPWILIFRSLTVQPLSDVLALFDNHCLNAECIFVLCRV
jgi:hypothetical protein